MGILSYYLATSIDGYLAREDGSVDWLNSFQSRLGTPYDYELYYMTVDTVLMGRKTWDIAKSFEEDPFSGKRRIIISKTKGKIDFPKNCDVYNSFDLIDSVNSDSVNSDLGLHDVTKE